MATTTASGAPVAAADEVRPWIRWVLVVLAVIDLYVGVWAVVAPERWFSDFPGLGRAWVAAEPPFNVHLATDAGAGFLAVGLVLLLAGVIARRDAVRVAAAGAIAHGLPHTLFHLLDPSDALSTGDRIASTGGLALGTAFAAVVLAATFRPGRPAPASR